MSKRIKVGFALAALALLVVTLDYSPTSPSSTPPHNLSRLNSLARAITFEPNLGQFDPAVRYIARTGGYILYLTDSGATTVLKPKSVTTPTRSTTHSALKYTLVGANSSPSISGVTLADSRSNYFIGNNPAKWRSDVPNYISVRYRDMYPNIDVVWRSEADTVEYDFVVAARADLNQIRLRIEGATLSLDGGDLLLRTANGTLRQPAPRIYQEYSAPSTVSDVGHGGGVIREAIAGGYTLVGDTVGFSVAAYDTSRPLVIDPIVAAYSTYLGGSGDDYATGIASDSVGNAYIVGYTFSSNFPRLNPYQNTYGGNIDAFVSKYNASGGLVYSTYLGGSDDDEGFGITVDNAGNAYLTGKSASINFPTLGSPNPIQATRLGPYDAFITKLNAAGNTLGYSTYLGGSDFENGYAIAVDGGGNAYVTGETTSNNFPRVNPYQTDFAGSTDAFLSKVNAAGNALTYSTYLGGGGVDSGNGLAVDGNGNAVISGKTASYDFPLQNAIQGNKAGGFDAFVTRFAANGGSLNFSSYAGGSSDDVANALALDQLGNAYFTGSTQSGDFPQVNAVQPNSAGGDDAFITRMNATPGTGWSYSTYLGGSGSDIANGIAVDGVGDAFVTGNTNSNTTFPQVSPLHPYAGGSSDAFITEVNATPGSGWGFSTFYGGSAADDGRSVAFGANSLYFSGSTASTDFPLVAQQQATPGGASDAFVAKLAIPSPTPRGSTTPMPPTNTPTRVPSPTNTPPSSPTPTVSVSTPAPTNTAGPTNTPSTPTSTPVVPPSPTSCSMPFSDLNGNIFFPAIQYLYCRGVVNGTDATHYSPGGTATRAQFAKTVVRAFNLTRYTPSGGGQSFTDVPNTYFGYLFIETGLNAGILSGYSASQCTAAGAAFPCYLPNRIITRAELTRLVVKAANYPRVTPVGGGQTFNDVPPSYFAYIYIETAVQHQIIRGYSDQTFRPNNPIRRDEMAQVVYKGTINP